MLAGLADVVEGADRLLRQVVVIAITQAHDLARGHIGGEGQRQLVEPLPRMRGHEEVVGRIQALVAQRLGVAGDGIGAQLVAQQAVVVHGGQAREVGVVLVHRQPHDADRAGAFRRVGVVVLGVEAQAAVVGDEAGVAFDHRRLDGLVVGPRQLGGRGRGAGVLVGAAVQRAGDLVQVDRQAVLGHAELVADLDDELQRVQRRGRAGHGLADGLGRDAPVAHGHQLRVEPVFGVAVGQHQAVAVEAGRLGRAQALGFQQPFMGVFRDGLLHQQAVHFLPDLGGEVAGDLGGVGLGAHRDDSWSWACSNCCRVQKAMLAVFSRKRAWPA
ncbi:Uncharacterised protein [Achromobacter sp. 2789STDY5608615]|nr:Uncharacterised protein [Achromobacter sp. 2789STDY5608615]